MLLPPLVLALAAAQLSQPSHAFAQDERMEFAVHYLGLRVGKARLSVGRAEGPLLPVFLETKTAGIVRIVDVRQQLATQLDQQTLLPSRASLDAHEAGYHHTDTAVFDRPAGKATVREQGKFDNTYVVDVPADTVDFVALVFRLRTLPLEPGMRHDFNVLAGRDVKRVTVEVVARERVETDAGAFETLRVRVPTGFDGKFSEKRPTYVWLSDDPRRVVVQIQTEFAIGRATAGLTAYRPGEAAKVEPPPPVAEPAAAPRDEAGPTAPEPVAAPKEEAASPAAEPASAPKDGPAARAPEPAEAPDEPGARPGAPTADP